MRQLRGPAEGGRLASPESWHITVSLFPELFPLRQLIGIFSPKLSTLSREWLTSNGNELTTIWLTSYFWRLITCMVNELFL